jgi:glycyl-tRNA synthetase beta chain
MSDFLLELRSEEIPARMQAGARANLTKLFLAETAARGLDLSGADHQPLVVWSTPRRLALIARGLPLATAAVSEEIKGPKVSAPAQALDGFLRKTGLTREQLTERDGVWFAISEKPGRATADVLAEAIPAIIRSFPWPKSQRWGAASLSTESLRWVRPLSGIVALLDGNVVDFAIDGIHSGRLTRGHRFHSHGDITIVDAESYAQELRVHHVIVHHAEREAIIRMQAAEAAVAAGLVLVEDEGLVIENAGLTEWPVPLLGRFDETFLEVPPEVIQLTARTNQKYFICRDAGGKLANAFICTANIVALDGGAAIVAGNRKVLAARLSDARFFWEQDRKKTLAEQALKLDRITFHEKLGTLADKVARVASLAERLASSGLVPNCDPALARQAAELCKADLVTEMVGEFPELQGLMGGYYARAEGLPDAVAAAIRDHYKPVGQNDDVPAAPVTVAVSLADKLDTLIGFFAVDEKPTGSKDPFALRRAGIAICSLILGNNLRGPLGSSAQFSAIDLFLQAANKVTAEINERYDDVVDPIISEVDFSAETNQVTYEGLTFDLPETMRQPLALVEKTINKDRIVADQVVAFIFDRLKVQQKEAGVRFDLIDAVFALGGEDDLVRLLARVQALQSFVGTEDGVNLLAGYKRAANILKKEGFAAGVKASAELAVALGDGPHPTPSPEGQGLSGYSPEPAEAALRSALEFSAPQADAAIAAEDFAGAMAALADLRSPIDAFFETVIVNDPDQIKRASRLGLLDQFRAAVHKVADFSLIEG